MIYVCRVDTGSRHIFDFADGIENVGSLATAIERQFKLEKSKQILLISGGEVLDDYQRKFFGFGFGCEDSPIYLIDKTNVEKREPPLIHTPLDNLNSEEVKNEINAALMLKPSFQTLQYRSQLTQRVNELDRHVNKLCQSLYDEQFWQYQGYLALIANLEDYISSFRKKEQTVRDQFEYFFNNVNNYKNTMKNMHKYISVLSKTRLIPSLLTDQQSASGTGSTLKLNESIQSIKNPNQTTTNIQSTPIKANRLAKNKTTNLFSSISSQSINNLTNFQIGDRDKKVLENLSEDLTLLDWIKSTDPNNKLDTVVDQTKKILDDVENKLKWNELSQKINDVLNQIENNSQLKEIEGLAKRLEDLKTFLDESNRLLLSQNEITDSLKSNFERAASLKEESVLKDLCKAHVTQLEFFKQNHFKIFEIAYKINKAKLELIKVIHSRLQLIMQVQKKIADYDIQLQIYFQQLRRLNVRLKLMEQFKKAPYVYVYSMKETVRRNEFAKSYKQFARLISDLLKNIHENESNQRKLFNTKTSSLNQHFILNILFRNLGEKFEPFITELKQDFDDKLPQLDEIEVNDIENEIITCLKSDQSCSVISPSTSASESSAFSSQTSPSTSNTSSSNTSTYQVDSTLNFENEAFLLKELNIEIEQIPKVKIKNEPHSYLSLLKRLSDFLTHPNDHSSETSSEVQQKPYFVLSPSTEELKQTINELRQRLTETRSTFTTYQSELNQQISKLIEFNQNIKNIEPKNSKKIIYSKILDNLEKIFSNEKNNIDLEEMDLDDQNFLNDLTNKILKFKQDQDLKLARLKQSTNAENQIKFNEAIKRVANEKDKLIEDLRQKQQGYLEKINNLEIEINELKLKLSPCQEMNLSQEIDTNKTTDELLKCDPNETKTKLKELMLQEKINQLQKQLSMFHTLPLTNNFYETIQLNSCNMNDVVLAVYSEEYGSYRVVHRTSNYLHFVYSVVFKNHEQKLSIKSPSNSTNRINSAEFSTSPSNENGDIMEVNEQQSQQEEQLNAILNDNQISCSFQSDSTITNDNNNSDNFFASDKQPQWFVGKVLVKEFCVARKENNRFKVPSGTRFFRVKLKPYNLF
ncbi:unnamed protein product [Brachionus calyciflorus]|uniref:RB1-inducible coiled-coil protein 1 n=1 Tax=Brachionus calyciflorus TaxID=104777 RepID=A0A813PUC9_9BILA|nr:unnamed protein product [Brachionus calyciflorus]